MICTYERPIYEDPSSGFCIYSFTTKDEAVPKEARNPRSYGKNPIMFTATGYRLPKSSNINVEMEGQWVHHERYGWQMSVESCVELIPPTREGILGYLSSGLIKGIGRKTAERIVEHFGPETLDILDASPERLKEISGITETKLKDIQESYVLTRSLKEMMTLLSPYGITVKQAAKIQTAFGADTMEVLRHCPYKLCQVQGFGFKTVDEIARKTGCNPDDPLRVQGAVRYILDMSAVSGGHLYLPVNDLTQKTYRLLNQGFASEAVSIPMIRENVGYMIQENFLVQDGEDMYLRSAYWQERNTAHNIARIVSYRAMGVDIEKELTEVQETLGYCLSAMQVQGTVSAFSHRLSIITGGPGTGKTTLINAILTVFRKVNPMGQVLLAAPTGRASRRMAECTGVQEACTLHSALGLYTGTEDDGEEKQADFLNADLIIIDECSMLDMWLADKLFSTVSEHSRLILVGDANQLPSVGAVPGRLVCCG